MIRAAESVDRMEESKIQSAEAQQLREARWLIHEHSERSLSRLNKSGGLIEAFDKHFGYGQYGSYGNPYKLDPDLINERNEWGSQAQKLPYSDLEGVMWLQNIGWELFQKCPTVISCTSKLISHIIGDGITYSAVERPRRRGRRPSRALVDTVEDSLEFLTSDELKWYEYQVESLQRSITTGDVFRKIRTKESDREYLRFRFVEPYHIRPPSDNQQALRENPFGIIFDRDDDAEPEGYWVNGESRAIPVSQLQHCKSNVWSKFPRGVPLFWQVYCHSVGVKETNHAMRELALVQSAYAVIRKHGEKSAASKIAQISAGVDKIKEDKNDGRPVPGLEVDTKGYEWEFPNHSVDARGFVDVIKSDQNFIGLVADMADYMSTGDSDQGARASLIVAGDPFFHRIKRERRMFGPCDINLLWMGVATLNGWSPERLNEVRSVINIKSKFPEIATMNSEGKVNDVINLVSAGLSSKQQARGEVGIDHDEAVEQIAEEREDEPLVRIGDGSGQAGTDNPQG